MKWKWLIGGVAAAVVILGVAGGAIMAQQSDGKESRMSAFAAKVASILGLEADDVENAMEQAREELADEALADKLDELVEEGTITQAQADEYESWVESRPDGLMFRGWPGGDTLDAKLDGNGRKRRYHPDTGRRVQDVGGVQARLPGVPREARPSQLPWRPLEEGPRQGLARLRVRLGRRRLAAGPDRVRGADLPSPVLKPVNPRPGRPNECLTRYS